MRIAYLINQYPKVSHSFIRREILALERQGTAVIRIALRGWDGPIVDEKDVLERKKNSLCAARWRVAAALGGARYARETTSSFLTCIKARMEDEPSCRTSAAGAFDLLG